MDECILEGLLSNLSAESRELFLDSFVPELDAAPSSLKFLRDYVSLNKPVVIRGAVDHWPAVEKWTPDYLRQKIGDKQVTVSVTPNGYADAVTSFPNGISCFMLPEEKQMSFNDFLKVLHQADSWAADNPNAKISDSKTNEELDGEIPPDGSSCGGCCTELCNNCASVDLLGVEGIFYVQKQNSNLSEEFNELQDDVLPLLWAEEAFDKSPDAINFWMGDRRAITSMHKDHYENIYCVVSGTKTFTLIPPTDQPFLPYEEFSVARYKQNDETKEFDVIEDVSMGRVPWIPVDVLNPDLERYPEFSGARPVTVTLGAGDVLYLPSLWYHHVQQSHACIAVNYWYDMNFDIKYCYYKFVESLLAERRKRKNESHQSAVNMEQYSDAI